MRSPSTREDINQHTARRCAGLRTRTCWNSRFHLGRCCPPCAMLLSHEMVEQVGPQQYGMVRRRRCKYRPGRTLQVTVKALFYWTAIARVRNARQAIKNPPVAGLGVGHCSTLYKSYHKPAMPSCDTGASILGSAGAVFTTTGAGVGAVKVGTFLPVATCLSLRYSASTREP
ncbi:MAG: hypothetical protein JWP59_405 [Massilia sp.]|nr:hypothetical protein [Massilia sp.]